MGGGGNQVAGIDQGRLLYDNTCTRYVAPEPEPEEEEEDDNTAVVIGGVVGGVVFVGAGVFALQYFGLVSILSKYDPIINGHLIGNV